MIHHHFRPTLETRDHHGSHLIALIFRHYDTGTNPINGFGIGLVMQNFIIDGSIVLNCFLIVGVYWKNVGTC